SDDQWHKYNGNRYIYMNRLRHDDFVMLFESLGHRILETQTATDLHLVNILKSGQLSLDDRFSSKPDDVLAITGSWMVTQANGERGATRTPNSATLQCRR